MCVCWNRELLVHVCNYQINQTKTQMFQVVVLVMFAFISYLQLIVESETQCSRSQSTPSARAR